MKHEFITIDTPSLHKAAPLLLEGCQAALSAFQDRTLSERRINANITFLERAIKEASKKVKY